MTNLNPKGVLLGAILTLTITMLIGARAKEAPRDETVVLLKSIDKRLASIDSSLKSVDSKVPPLNARLRELGNTWIGEIVSALAEKRR